MNSSNPQKTKGDISIPEMKDFLIMQSRIKLKEKVKTQPETRDKTVEVDVEYVSLHGSIRNTFSEAEGTTEHNLRAGRSL